MQFVTKPPHQPNLTFAKSATRYNRSIRAVPVSLHVAASDNLVHT
ncbi:hypothetical protein EV13_0979 [Prochlorococcus sp. MIT 0702]|nr:hypothetical protein EV13_0979 [Prochlorococcus sp. MIT 0702]